AAHHRGGERRGERAHEAATTDRPRSLRDAGEALLRQRRLHRRPPRLHGEAQAALRGEVEGFRSASVIEPSPPACGGRGRAPGARVRWVLVASAIATRRNTSPSPSPSRATGATACG